MGTSRSTGKTMSRHGLTNQPERLADASVSSFYFTFNCNGLPISGPYIYMYYTCCFWGPYLEALY